VLVLNAYTDTSVGSPQYDWLANDLKSINRTITPWVISSSHCPWCKDLGIFRNIDGSSLTRISQLRNSLLVIPR